MHNSITVEISDVQFVSDNLMMLSLSNDRTFTVPLDKFPDIANLNSTERADFEIIDGENLSFLAIDGIYNIQDLTGL